MKLGQNLDRDKQATLVCSNISIKEKQLLYTFTTNVNITKYFLFITDGEAKTVKMYVLMMFFQDSLTFPSKAGAYLSGAHYSVPQILEYITVIKRQQLRLVSLFWPNRLAKFSAAFGTKNSYVTHEQLMLFLQTFFY